MKYYLDRDLIKSVISLASVIEARDPYTGGHTWRVSKYAYKLAMKAGLSENKVIMVQLGSLVHDIGKIGISDAILLKPGVLTDDEYSTMKKHPSIGYDLLKFHPLFPLLVDSIYHHHRRSDGKGYPDSKEDLSIISKITCIADAFDAMTSTRPYRLAMEAKKAYSILESEKGKQFDAHLVDLFLELADAGELNHILGHCGDHRVMLSCNHCGPIISTSRNTKAGDHLPCPNCHGDFIVSESSGQLKTDFSGVMIEGYASTVDFELIEEALIGLPEYLEI